MPARGGRGGQQFRYRGVWVDQDWSRNSWVEYTVGGNRLGFVAPTKIPSGSPAPGAANSLWIEFTASVITGPPGARGPIGNATILMYIRSATVPTLPTDGDWDGTTLTLPVGYSLTNPTGTDVLYAVAVVLDSNIPELDAKVIFQAQGMRGAMGADSTVPGPQGTIGPPGNGFVILYQRSATTPSLPTDGDWDGTALTLPAGWFRSDPDPTSSDNLWSLIGELDSVNDSFNPIEIFSARGIPGPQGASAPQTRFQYSDDGIIYNDTPSGDITHLQVSTDGGANYTAFSLERGPMGIPGTVGAAGDSADIQYSINGVDWHDDLEQDDVFIRFRVGTGSWSIGRRFVGAGGTGSDTEAWNGQTTYSIGDTAYTATSIYISRTDNNNGNNPDTDTTNWGDLLGSISGLGQAAVQALINTALNPYIDAARLTAGATDPSNADADNTIAQVYYRNGETLWVSARGETNWTEISGGLTTAQIQALIDTALNAYADAAILTAGGTDPVNSDADNAIAQLYFRIGENLWVSARGDSTWTEIMGSGGGGTHEYQYSADKITWVGTFDASTHLFIRWKLSTEADYSIAIAIQGGGSGYIRVDTLPAPADMIVDEVYLLNTDASLWERGGAITLATPASISTRAFTFPNTTYTYLDERATDPVADTTRSEAYFNSQSRIFRWHESGETGWNDGNYLQFYDDPGGFDFSSATDAFLGPTYGRTNLPTSDHVNTEAEAVAWLEDNYNSAITYYYYDENAINVYCIASFTAAVYTDTLFHRPVNSNFRRGPAPNDFTDNAARDAAITDTSGYDADEKLFITVGTAFQHRENGAWVDFSLLVEGQDGTNAPQVLFQESLDNVTWTQTDDPNSLWLRWSTNGGVTYSAGRYIGGVRTQWEYSVDNLSYHAIFAVGDRWIRFTDDQGNVSRPISLGGSGSGSVSGSGNSIGERIAYTAVALPTSPGVNVDLTGLDFTLDGAHGGFTAHADYLGIPAVPPDYPATAINGIWAELRRGTTTLSAVFLPWGIGAAYNSAVETRLSVLGDPTIPIGETEAGSVDIATIFRADGTFTLTVRGNDLTVRDNLFIDFYYGLAGGGGGDGGGRINVLRSDTSISGNVLDLTIPEITAYAVGLRVGFFMPAASNASDFFIGIGSLTDRQALKADLSEFDANELPVDTYVIAEYDDANSRWITDFGGAGSSGRRAWAAGVETVVDEIVYNHNQDWLCIAADDGNGFPPSEGNVNFIALSAGSLRQSRATTSASSTIGFEYSSSFFTLAVIEPTITIEHPDSWTADADGNIQLLDARATISGQFAGETYVYQLDNNTGSSKDVDVRVTLTDVARGTTILVAEVTNLHVVGQASATLTGRNVSLTLSQDEEFRIDIAVTQSNGVYLNPAEIEIRKIGSAPIFTFTTSVISSLNRPAIDIDATGVVESTLSDNTTRQLFTIEGDFLGRMLEQVEASVHDSTYIYRRFEHVDDIEEPTGGSINAMGVFILPTNWIEDPDALLPGGIHVESFVLFLRNGTITYNDTRVIANNQEVEFNELARYWQERAGVIPLSIPALINFIAFHPGKSLKGESGADLCNISFWDVTGAAYLEENVTFTSNIQGVIDGAALNQKFFELRNANSVTGEIEARVVRLASQVFGSISPSNVLNRQTYIPGSNQSTGFGIIAVNRGDFDTYWSYIGPDGTPWVANEDPTNACAFQGGNYNSTLDWVLFYEGILFSENLGIIEIGDDNLYPLHRSRNGGWSTNTSNDDIGEHRVYDPKRYYTAFYKSVQTMGYEAGFNSERDLITSPENNTHDMYGFAIKFRQAAVGTIIYTTDLTTDAKTSFMTNVHGTRYDTTKLAGQLYNSSGDIGQLLSGRLVASGDSDPNASDAQLGVSQAYMEYTGTTFVSVWLSSATATTWTEYTHPSGSSSVELTSGTGAPSTGNGTLSQLYIQLGTLDILHYSALGSDSFEALIVVDNEFKGIWTGSFTYNINHIVIHDGILWRSLGNSTNVIPDLSRHTIWQALTAPDVTQYTNNARTRTGQLAIYENYLFYVNQHDDGTGNAPPTNTNFTALEAQVISHVEKTYEDNVFLFQLPGGDIFAHDWLALLSNTHNYSGSRLEQLMIVTAGGNGRSITFPATQSSITLPAIETTSGITSHFRNYTAVTVPVSDGDVFIQVKSSGETEWTDYMRPSATTTVPANSNRQFTWIADEVQILLTAGQELQVRAFSPTGRFSHQLQALGYSSLFSGEADITTDAGNALELNNRGELTLHDRHADTRHPILDEEGFEGSYKTEIELNKVPTWENKVYPKGQVVLWGSFWEALRATTVTDATPDSQTDAWRNIDAPGISDERANAAAIYRLIYNGGIETQAGTLHKEYDPNDVITLTNDGKYKVLTANYFVDEVSIQRINSTIVLKNNTTSDETRASVKFYYQLRQPSDTDWQTPVELALDNITGDITVPGRSTNNPGELVVSIVKEIDADTDITGIVSTGQVRFYFEVDADVDADLELWGHHFEFTMDIRAKLNDRTRIFVDDGDLKLHDEESDATITLWSEADVIAGRANGVAIDTTTRAYTLTQEQLEDYNVIDVVLGKADGTNEHVAALSISTFNLRIYQGRADFIGANNAHPLRLQALSSEPDVSINTPVFVDLTYDPQDRELEITTTDWGFRSLVVRP